MLPWILFIAVILLFLALDLGVFNRTAHVIKTKEAAIWTSVWVSVALAFSGVIWWLFSNFEQAPEKEGAPYWYG